MSRLAVVLLLGLVGCSSMPKHDESAGDKPAQPRVLRQTDDLCMSDCMGNGGQREFCSDRCTN